MNPQQDQQTAPAAPSAGKAKLNFKTSDVNPDYVIVCIGQIKIGTINGRSGTLMGASGSGAKCGTLVDSLHQLTDGIITRDEIKESLRDFAIESGE